MGLGQNADLRNGEDLVVIKSNRKGIAQNTFYSEDISVSGPGNGIMG